MPLNLGNYCCIVCLRPLHVRYSSTRPPVFWCSKNRLKLSYYGLRAPCELQVRSSRKGRNRRDKSYLLNNALPLPLVVCTGPAHRSSCSEALHRVRVIAISRVIFLLPFEHFLR